MAEINNTVSPKEVKPITLDDISIKPTGAKTTSKDFKENYSTIYTGEGDSGFSYNKEITDNYPFINTNLAGFNVDTYRNEYSLDSIFKGPSTENDFKYNFGLDNEKDAPKEDGQHNTLENSFHFYGDAGDVLSVRNLTK